MIATLIPTSCRDSLLELRLKVASRHESRHGVAIPRFHANGGQAATSVKAMSLNESIVETAALEWFGELGYAVGHGPQLAPCEPAAAHVGVDVGRLEFNLETLS